ncbi:MAG: GH116 family glycosyl hydrolase [Elusimicrobiota bacterium]
MKYWFIACLSLILFFSENCCSALFDIPVCAWHRDIGDLPPSPASQSVNRGIALGGFGANSFMYSISGAFGPWGVPEYPGLSQYWLYEAAFHIYEKVGANPATVKCLSTYENMMPAFRGPGGSNQISTGDGDYYALQPFGWTTYSIFSSDVESKFFSPIIADNYKESSYPIAVWHWKLHNKSATPTEISVMFTFPNAIYSNHVRTGFQSILNSSGAIKGIVLKAVDGTNTPETQNSEWCIAAYGIPGSTVSYVTSWNKSGDGGDIWDNFADDGVLSDSALDGSNSAGAIAVRVYLEPGQNVDIPIVLAWDFPLTKFKNVDGDGTEWWKKYTMYFSTNSDNSFNIAVEGLTKYLEWEDSVYAWMKPYVESTKLPEWLKTAAFNELYYSQFGGIFFEAGLKSGHVQEFEGLHENDYKHMEIECQAYTALSPLDVRHYNSIMYLLFWPDIEKTTLKVYADAIEYSPVPGGHPAHETPHDLGDPGFDPLFSFGYPWNGLLWKDLPSRFIQQCWRYYYFSQDKDFLDYVWPAIKDTFEYAKTLDTDSDYIINNQAGAFGDTTFDTWRFFGTGILCGGLWVGALEALEKMAQVESDPILSEVSTWLTNAKSNLNSQLWYSAGGYYKTDTAGDFPTAIMADGLNGQRYCEYTGLADILPKERMKAHLLKIYDKLVVPCTDYTSDGIGDVGALNGIKENGEKLGYQQSDEVWVGNTYSLAASMYRNGLKDEALKTAYGLYYTVYVNEETAYWFNVPEAWHCDGKNPRPPEWGANPSQYMRPRAVWELVSQIENGQNDDSSTPSNTDTTPPVITELVKPPERIGMIGGKLMFKISSTDPESSTQTVTFNYSVNSAAWVPAIVESSCTIYSMDLKDTITQSCTIQYFWTAVSSSGYASGTSTGTTIISQKTTVDNFISGKLTVDDGNPEDGNTSIDIPAGALSSPVNLSIEQKNRTDVQSGNPPADTQYPSTVYDFTAGSKETTFLKPVTLTMLYTDLDRNGIEDSSGKDERKMRMFWWDGLEWRFIGGKVDVDKKTVTVQVMHLSRYAVFSAKVLSADDYRPKEKIITPAGSPGKNDYAQFGVSGDIKINIYDVKGAKVRALENGLSIWDGKDENGDIVEGGVYIYQIKTETQLISGTILVVK